MPGNRSPERRRGYALPTGQCLRSPVRRDAGECAVEDLGLDRKIRVPGGFLDARFEQGEFGVVLLKSSSVVPLLRENVEACVERVMLRAPEKRLEPGAGAGVNQAAVVGANDEITGR